MKILANDGISNSGEKVLKEAGLNLLDNRISQEHLIPFINENQVEVLLVKNATQVTRELIDACPSLKIIGKGGESMDNIEVEYAKSKGIFVINTPNAFAKSVAELVFAHFLTLIRFLHDSNRNMPLEGDSKFAFLKKSYEKATELSGKTLGIIGFGNIGKEVAKIGIGLGMKIIFYTRKPKTDNVSLEFFDGRTIDFEFTSIQDMETFLKEADFISINTSETTEYIIDTPEFEMMKDGVFIVNTAKGGVINEVTLIDYIENKKVAGAALDVFETEPKPEIQILMNPSLSLSPHVGGSTLEAQERIGTELAQQIIDLQKLI